MFSSLQEDEPTTLKTKTFIKFAWYAARSSLADISPKSYHLTVFELVNPPRYTYFPSSEYRILVKDQKSKLPLSVAL